MLVAWLNCIVEVIIKKADSGAFLGLKKYVYETKMTIEYVH